ncbi:MAG: hypothetical protein V7774_09015 [Pseudorhizobium pelagicum]|uniref:hypothetical protein n=1 Tax=Pseudorhizobium pelagicum TaxID=1509405 RepID=UPI00345FE025
MEKEHRSEDRVSENPTDNDKAWLRAAVVSFIFAVIAFGFAAGWVFAGADESSNERAQAFAPFGAALAAIVTFFTIVWRGVLNTRQLEYQAAQISHQAAQLEQTRRQTEAKDEETLAKLLIDAAKLIAEKDKQPQVVAGIAALDIVIRDPKHRYGVEAMDLLADLLLDTYGDQPLSRINRAVLQALGNGEKLGIMSRVEGKFTRPTATFTNNGYWHYIPGIPSLSFTGGSLSQQAYERMFPRIKLLREVTLNGVEVDLTTGRFHKCTFTDCRVTAARWYDFKDCEFVNCDFSGATIKRPPSRDLDVDLRTRRNFYRAGDPPYDQHGESLAALFWDYDEIEHEDDDIPF